MKESIRNQGVRRHDARALPVVFGMHRRCVLDGIDRALRQHRFLDALIVFHRNGFDPGHESTPPALSLACNQCEPPGWFATVAGNAVARLPVFTGAFSTTETCS